MGKEEQVTIPLKYTIPVPVEGEEGKTVDVKEITLGRLKIKHLKMIPREALTGEEDINPMTAIPLIAGMSGLPESSIDELDAADLKGVIVALMDFLKDFLEDGEKKSTE